MPTGTSASVEINGYALRTIRQLVGTSTLDFAQAVGVTAGYVRSIENGLRKAVSEGTYAAILSALAINDYRVLLANPHGSASIGGAQRSGRSTPSDQASPEVPHAAPASGHAPAPVEPPRAPEAGASGGVEAVA